MESLVRFLIGFMLIYQLLPLAECKVIKPRSGHDGEISFGPEVTLLNASQVELNKTSINYSNATQSTASNIDSSSHGM
jgi:transcription elongation GreA/GreB family factor